jgi:integrase
VTAPTLRGALDARRRILNELERGVRPDSARASVEDFSARWLADCERRLRPLTVKGYRSLLARHVVPAIGGMKLRDIDRETLNRLYASLPSPALRSRVHGALSAMLGYAVRDVAVLSMNPCTGIRRPKYAAPEARHLDPSQARALLRAAEGRTIEPAIILGLAAGLRIGEAAAVRWGDVSADGILTVRRSVHGTTKSGKVRSLKLPASAMSSLKRCRTAQAEHLLSVGVRLGPDTPLVADGLGRGQNVETLRRSFAQFAAEQGLEITYHALRHSNAVALLTSGADVRTVAGRLGHSAPVLLRTYGHFIRSADETAAEKLEALLC